MAGDIDEEDGDGDAKWRAKHQKEFEKERKEHPKFTDQQVWQVVRDHAKEKKMMEAGIDFEVFVPLTKSVDSAPAGGINPDEADWFAGIASTSDLDRDGDVVTEKALNKGANDLMRNSTVFFNHKHDELGIGRVTKSWVEGNQLRVQISPSKAPGVQDVVMQMHEGILRSLSIGGKVRHYDMLWNDKLQKDVRMIDDIDFYEVSVVGIPANPNATISSHIAKAFNARTALVAVSDAGKGGGDLMDKDDKEAKAPLAAPALEKKEEPPKSKEQEDKEKKEKEEKEKKEKEACSSSMRKEEDSKCEAVQTPSQPALPPVVVKTAEPEPTAELKSLRDELSEVKKDVASLRSVKKGLVVNENPVDETQAPVTTPLNQREESFKKMVEDNLAIL